MATVYDRWFITPAVTIEETDGDGDVISTGLGPKYSDDSRIDGFAGNTTEPSVISTHYAALTQTYPDVSEWYIVRMYGEGNDGWSALNEIHNQLDTRTLADHASDVAPVLKDVFPGLNRSVAGWAESFRVDK